MKDHDIPTGARVPDSRWFRAYCPRCGEAMRVTQERVKSPPMCNECDPKHVGVGSPCKSPEDIDANRLACFSA